MDRVFPLPQAPRSRLRAVLRRTRTARHLTALPLTLALPLPLTLTLPLPLALTLTLPLTLTLTLKLTLTLSLSLSLSLTAYSTAAFLHLRNAKTPMATMITVAPITTGQI